MRILRLFFAGIAIAVGLRRELSYRQQFRENNRMAIPAKNKRRILMGVSFRFEDA